MRAILFFATIFIFLGCKNQQDDAPGLILSGKFVPEDIIYYDAPVMYIKDRTISDTNIINTYLRSKNPLNSFVYNATGIAGPYYPSIDFLENDSIVMSLPSGSVARFKADIEITADNEIRIHRKDSLVFPLPTYPILPSRCDTIAKIASKYTGRETLYINYRVVYPTYNYKQKEGRLYLPLYNVSMNSVRPNGAYCNAYYSGGGLGSLHKSPYPVNELLAGDTAVYQTYKVWLRKM